MERQLEFDAFAEESNEAVAQLATAAEEDESEYARFCVSRYADTLATLNDFRKGARVVRDMHERNKWEHAASSAKHDLQDDYRSAAKKLGAERAESLLRKAFAELAERDGGLRVTEHDIKFALSDRLW